MELYQYSVGREPDARPGVERPDGSVFDDTLGYVLRVLVDGKWREGKNIGLNRLAGMNGCNGVLSICHDFPISNALNKILRFNSFATLHDQWMNSLELNTGREMFVFENIGSMAPAVLINYRALYENYKAEIEQAKDINKADGFN